MNNKHGYQQFCEENRLPLFYHPWWLDLVYGVDQWNIIQVFGNNNQILAVMPYALTHKFSFRFLLMPPLTPYQGPWLLTNSQQKYHKKLASEKDILNEIIAKLPDYSRFDVNFHPDMLNVLPFYWSGFESYFRYTYVLDDLSDTGKVYEGFRSNVKRNIKTAAKEVRIVVNNVQHLLWATTMTYQRQRKQVPVDERLIKNVVEESIRRDSGRVYSAVDNQDNLHAAICVVWDNDTAYYLMGGGNPKYRKSGAMSGLMWQAIKEVSGNVGRFDFEGSMVEPIEHFFRGFGAKQTPYAKVTRINSKWLKLKWGIVIMSSG